MFGYSIGRTVGVYPWSPGYGPKILSFGSKRLTLVMHELQLACSAILELFYSVKNEVISGFISHPPKIKMKLFTRLVFVVHKSFTKLMYSGAYDCFYLSPRNFRSFSSSCCQAHLGFFWDCQTSSPNQL